MRYTIVPRQITGAKVLFGLDPTPGHRASLVFLKNYFIINNILHFPVLFFHFFSISKNERNDTSFEYVFVLRFNITHKHFLDD